jgi:hypothetical protein
LLVNGKGKENNGLGSLTLASNPIEPHTEIPVLTNSDERRGTENARRFVNSPLIAPAIDITLVPVVAAPPLADIHQRDDGMWAVGIHDETAAGPFESRTFAEQVARRTRHSDIDLDQLCDIIGAPSFGGPKKPD